MKRGRRGVERLGDILLRAGIVDQDQIDKALERQNLQPGRFGSQLLQLGAVSEDDLAKALSVQHQVPAYLVGFDPIDPGAVERLPREMAQRLRTVPISWDPASGVLGVVTGDPTNLHNADEIRFATGARRVLVKVASEGVVERLYRRHYEGAEAEPVLAAEVHIPPASGIRAPAPEQPARGTLLLGEPDRSRRRALGTLLEAFGFRVLRPRTLEEFQAAAAEGSFTHLWAQQEWGGTLQHGQLRLYGDLVRELDDHLSWAQPLAEQSLALAEDAGRRLLGTEFLRARQAVSLVRFLGARSGVRGAARAHMELAAWRAALAAWQVPAALGPFPGRSTLEAVAAYQRAVQGGASPRAAADALREDPNLDPDAVTRLLRWALGADLLRNMEPVRRVLARFHGPEAPRALLEHLRQGGWDVIEEERPAGEVEAVVADLESALAYLEHGTEGPAPRPPVFVIASQPSEPDVMYALRMGVEDVFPTDTHPDVIETKLSRALSRGRPAAGLVSGDLRDMALSDMLQILSNGMKTAVIRVRAPHAAGEVALVEGQIVDARSGALTGEDALYEMITWEEGAFRIEPNVRTRARTVQGSTEGLLMEGFRRLDEARRGVSEQVPELG